MESFEAERLLDGCGIIRQRNIKSREKGEKQRQHRGRDLEPFQRGDFVDIDPRQFCLHLVQVFFKKREREVGMALLKHFPELDQSDEVVAQDWKVFLAEQRGLFQIKPAALEPIRQVRLRRPQQTTQKMIPSAAEPCPTFKVILKASSMTHDAQAE